MINSNLQKLTGTPCNASEGKMTRPAPVSGPGALGMGQFSPRKGQNKQGTYIVDGCGSKSKKSY